MKKNNKKTTLLVIGIVVFLLIIRYGFVFFLFIFGLENTDAKFTIDNNVINVEDGKFNIEETGASYDEKTECYILNLKVERNSKIKQSIFDKIFQTGSGIDITYQVFDQDNYVLGEATSSISNINKNDKWKVKLSYCESDANEVNKYKIERISIY